MTLYYVTIFEEKGRYDPKFDLNQVGQMNMVRVGMELGAKPVYRGEIQNLEQAKLIVKFVEESNRAGKFDTKRLEELLEAKK